MTSTEDRARAAMRAIAGTVNGAPPLQLTTAPDLSPAADEVRPREYGPRPHGPRRRLRWPVLAPVAAAVAVVAIAVALVAVRNSPNGRVTTPTATPAAVPSSVPAYATPAYTTTEGVPAYYVAWMQADTPYLIVGSTLTGQVRATVKAPDNVYLDAVYGTAGSDSTFIVTGQLLHGPDSGTIWYLLRIAPGSHDPARLTPLRIPDEPNPAGAALSPDGTELAVALPGSPATLRVYSVATGALLHSWSAPSGEFAAVKTTADGWKYAQLALRWTADGRSIAFAWNASAIRVLDAAAPDGSLLAGSRVLATIGTTYAPEATLTCVAWQGWEPITVARGAPAGQGVICGGGELNELPGIVSGSASPAASATTGNAACTARNQPSVGFLESTENSQGGGYLGLTAGETECPGTAQAGDGAYVGWSNGDGSVLVGSLVWDGHVRFGIFRGQRFTPLPALPASVPVPAGELVGTVAW